MKESVHLQEFFAYAAAMEHNAALIKKWERIRALRRVVTGALEIARRDKMIGASLEAAPVLFVTDAADAALFESVDLAEIAITSTASCRMREAARRRLYVLPDVQAWRRAFRASRGQEMRALLDGPAGSGHRPAMTISAPLHRGGRRLWKASRHDARATVGLALSPRPWRWPLDQGSKLVLLYGAGFHSNAARARSPRLAFF